MDAPRILWIADEPPLSDGPAGDGAAPPEGWSVQYHRPQELAPNLSVVGYDAIVLRVREAFPGAERWLRRARLEAPDVPVVVQGDVADTEALARLGASLLSQESPVWKQLRGVLDRRNGMTPPPRTGADPGEEWERLLVGESPAVRQVSHIIRMVASRRCTVLITGETGTGKEVAARCLHLAGSRRHGPLVTLNCSAVPDNLLETELFGHVRGAFTGAVQSRVGRFEQAGGGTLFLDEIGEVPPALQAKLLRVLQEREFQRVGSSETVKVDVRVIAATNCDLPRAIEEGRFREDLYYRLNVVPIQMPALRERPGDIPLLVAHFVQKICCVERIAAKTLAPDALDRLRDYSWPGNVRQLENSIEMAVALSGDRRVLTAEDFPLPAPRPRSLPNTDSPRFLLPESGLDYEKTLALIERTILQQALERTGGNKKAAAEMLNLKRTTLSAKVRSLEEEAVY